MHNELCADLSSQVHSLETVARSREPTGVVGPDRHDYTALARLPDATETSFRHSGWSDRRSLITTALGDSQMPPGRIDRFTACGGCAHVQQRDDGHELRVIAHYCHDRWCVPCQRIRALTIQQHLGQLCEKQLPRFLTLTLRHSHTPLASQLDRLYRSFEVLRRRKSWLANVTGGVAFLEIKVSERDGLWHPHLHVLIIGRFWDVREISQEWHAVTGDSSIVDLRACKALDHLFGYVTKYVTKTAHSSVFRDPSKLSEAVTALHGRRMCIPFGTWAHAHLTEPPPSSHAWIDIAPLSRLVSAGRAHEPWATRWFEALCRQFPDLLTLVPDERPPPPRPAAAS